MNRISLNVIVFNEETRLEACLLDAREFVDEIVVVDQMSTDGTPEIARRLADVFVPDVHHGHAEPSRELAASRSSGDWILILDADEMMSDRLKVELRDLVERETDGYWIRKVNFVDGVDTGTVDHYRLVRKSRVRFDPGPHGGATAVSDNVERLEWIGIVHEKSVDEQLYDDARYERIALEDQAPTSSKRNWLSHNLTLREQRRHERRRDLEVLVPPDAERVLVVGDLTVDLSGHTRAERDDAEVKAVDAAVVSLDGEDPQATIREVADLLRPGGALVGTAPVARNLRHIEEFVDGVLVDGTPSERPAVAGFTRRQLGYELEAAGLDVRWMLLVGDGWLDPVALRPDGSGAVVQSDQFLLRNVPAEVVEELTAGEIVFAATTQPRTDAPECSVILVVLAGADPGTVVDGSVEDSPDSDHELVVVHSRPGWEPPPGVASVLIGADSSPAARWNAGARAANGELLAFLSADAEPQPGWLAALTDAYRSGPDIGAVGSKVIAKDGTIEHAGLVLGPDRIPYRVYEGDPANAFQVNRPRIMPAVAAEGMMTDRARFVEVGGFDETLSEDLADADYCLRLRSRGLAILYTPYAALRSVTRSTTGTRSGFGRASREFVTRWSSTSTRSDEVVCRSDGLDANTQWNRSWRLPRPTGPATGGVPAIAWSSHFLEQGGYTEEALAAVEALDDAGLHVVANPVLWAKRQTPLPARQAERLAELMDRDLPEDFVHVAHIGANRLKRHPAAMASVGRTMFESDGLPPDWRDGCNAMDEIWVPSEHNLRTFANAGVPPWKLHKVPETFDRELFDPSVTPLAIEGVEGFVFLSIFSWIPRKAWDVLLRAWYGEFGKHDDVTLVVKTDTDHTPGTNCRQEIESFVRSEMDRNPKKGPRVVILDRPLATDDVPRLYRAADAFVLASHGEGWGRPLMEAMAMGLPTIGTRWSGNLEFMDDDNSYLVDAELVDAPPDSWLHGHRWATPSVKGLRRALRRVYEHRDEAAATGARARADVLETCRPELVAEAVRDRLEDLDRHPVHVPLGPPVVLDRLGPSGRRRSRPDGRRLTACIVVQEDGPSSAQCLASLGEVADATVVVHAGSNDDMALVRNEALDRATGSWVLMLDASHTLDPASIDVISELVGRNQFVGHAARQVRQFNLDGAVSAVEQRTPLLFPLHPDLRFVGRVAEQLLPRRADLEFRLIPSRLVIHQHETRPDILHPVARARRQLPLLERAVHDEPDEPFHGYNLGVALGHLGLHGEAEAALRRAIEHAPRRAPWVPSAYASLSTAVAAQGDKDEAVAFAKAATKRAPDWAHAWCLLGTALVDAGRLDKAVRAYQRALDQAGDRRLAGDHYDDVSWLACAGIGRIHLARGDYGAAADCLRRAVTANPSNAELRVLLARAYDAIGRSSDAGHHLEVAVMDARAGTEPYVAVGDFFMGRAEDALLRGLADNPESHVLLGWIERLRAARAMT